MKPLKRRIGEVLKKGYELELLQPSPVGAACALMAGRRIKPLPTFKKVSGG